MPGTERAKVDEFTLRIATDEQQEQHWRAQFVPWNRGRSWEVFHAQALRDRLESEHVAGGAYKTWVLVRRDDLDGEIYAGVETYRRRGFAKSQADDDGLSDCILYGVASVVTPVKHHKRGYASHMMRLLHYCIGDTANLPPFPTAWGAPPEISSTDRSDIPPGIASELWSDVGSSFYQRCTISEDLPGWITVDERNQEIVWKALSPDGSDMGDWDWVYMPELQSISEQLSKDVRRDLAYDNDTGETKVAYDPKGPSPISSIPSRCMGSRPKTWQFNTDTEPIGIRIPASHGARDATATDSDKTEDALVLFTWSDNSIGPRLLITYISHLTPNQLPQLLSALDHIAQQSGRAEGWVWGLDANDELTQAWKALPGREVQVGRRREMDGHLWAVAWYGPSENGKVGKVVDSQMWHWC